MLRDRYIFKYGKKASQEMLADIKEAMDNWQHHSDGIDMSSALCFLVLLPFIKKLVSKCHDRFAPEKISISMNREHAVAFHIAYRRGIMPTANALVTEMFTVIDRSLNNTL